MDRMFEQAQKLYTEELSWWTQQSIKATEEAMASGETLLKTGRGLVNDAIKAQTTLATTMSARLNEIGTRQMTAWQSMFRPAA